jgi:hypothetical protein
MSKEELLLECWRELSPEAQNQVLTLAQSLKPELQSHSELEQKPKLATDLEFVPRTPLSEKLWEIRQRIVASGMPLLGINLRREKRSV